MFGILSSNSVGEEEESLTVKILEAAVDTSSRFQASREGYRALRANREERWRWLIPALNGEEQNTSVSLSQAVLISLQKKEILGTENILH